MALPEDEYQRTDYLTETLMTEKGTQIEVFNQMLEVLERHGLCRSVYHRLGYTLFPGDDRVRSEFYR